VRWGTNDPTPWPPEVAAGENPPPGAIVDYYLAASASGTVKLEILGAGGKVMRTYSSDEPVRNPDPAVDPEAYNKICQKTPNAADCNLPLYWPAPQMRIETTAGMHRFSWDMHYDALGAGGGRGGSMGAVPHRTYGAVSSPWAAPGGYTVRLSVGGKSYTQPITLKMDPRVKTSAAGLAQLTSLTTEMYNGARDARAAYDRARALIGALDNVKGADAEKLKKEVEAIAPPPPAGGAGRGGRGGGGGGRGAAAAPAGPATLESASNAMNAAAMAMQAADVAPTANQVAACGKARSEGAGVLAKWRTLSTAGLAGLNAKLKASGQQGVKLPE
jgi:hypothetical protein